MASKTRAKASAKRSARKGKAPAPPVAEKAKVDTAVAEKDPLKLESFMGETNGGGSPESVPGFNMFRAVTAGFGTKRVSGATIVASQPDGGFFSEGGQVQVGLGFPAAKPENVIGADNRTRVADTALTPWRCICHLEVEYERGPVGCGTGFFVGPQTIVTAAHVLVDRRSNGWKNPRMAVRVRVLPGRNGTLAPYGYVVSGKFQIPDVWTEKTANQMQAATLDYAAIDLTDSECDVSEQPLGERLGFFGLKAYTAAEEAGVKLLFVNNAGYPMEADKPYGTLWYNAGRISKWSPEFVEYMVDTEAGQSGSPIYLFDEKTKERYVVAIHTTGDFVNRGLRITPQIFDAIRKWAKR
ncbi:trypsin-like peptidase domain-containing protein [Bradyrhizobium yuanmingense]|uniref:trypsin-like peptidase domain-containing protein n=1 Tax=Bradyrhizobium yuanmingense TaxID=108015 RepID=UPI0023BA07C3|nr:trypsin-like peptidase domain-containing protein [Bradyrhizobium yuanmingense]MDF0584166.1 trypsin-like peptidase domain-containing protein [Bradyrhizobium yuanmingense]